jgi:hypothetical protein
MLIIPIMQTNKWWRKQDLVLDMIISDDWTYLIIVCIVGMSLFYTLEQKGKMHV